MSNLERYSMTVAQIAKRLGYNEQHVRRMAKTGKLPAIKRIRQWMFDPIEVEQFLQDKTTEARLG